MARPIVSVIGAYTEDGGYGLLNGMPWPNGGLPGDLKRFKSHTTDCPDGRVNILICGKKTYDTMSGLPLEKEKKRVLVGVSESTQPREYGSTRFIVNTIESAVDLAMQQQAYRVIFIGGKYFWNVGLEIADIALLTIVHKTCDDPRVKKLAIPLHVTAASKGFVLDNQSVAMNPDKAWAPFEFQNWRKKSIP